MTTRNRIVIAVLVVAIAGAGLWAFGGATLFGGEENEAVLAELETVADNTEQDATQDAEREDTSLLVDPSVTDSTAPAVGTVTTDPSTATTGPQSATYEIVETLTHDTGAFTQGLEISDGRLFESTGLVGQSTIRELDLTTGSVRRSSEVAEVFAEGLTIIGDTALQLTWQSEIAYRYDIDTFEVIDSYVYDGEGWGICQDSATGNLIMSDGSAELEFRDPDTFDSLGSVEVLLDDAAVSQLNELECVNGTVWANIWMSDFIIEIEPATGTVITVLNLAELRPESTLNDNSAVLNGLAFDPTDGTMLVTGKRWPVIYRLDISSL